MTERRFGTRAIHVGQEPEPVTGAVITPIFATSTYAQKSPGVHTGYEYSRTRNPTRKAFEACVASLEGGVAGFAFASGLAAEATVLDLLPAGSHVIACNDLYGGTFRLFERVRKPSAGLEVTYVDPVQVPNGLESALRPNTKMIWIESPTNPGLKLVDLAGVVKFARAHNLISVCDNTFATPFLQTPLSLGFDVVFHSATKYLNGHSDIVAGIVVVGKQELAERMAFLQNAVGAVASPFDSFLASRGLKTLHVRMERHCANALALAQWLEQCPEVERVLYPHLPSHPQHELAKRQMCGGGGMITMFLKGGLAEARRFLESVRVFTLAESLGGVESLIEHPAIMTHASLTPEQRAQAGISDTLVRLSVGIEDLEDLREDLEQALAKAFKG